MDVLTVSRTEYLALPKNKQDALKLSVCTSTGIGDVSELKARILSYIRVNSLNNVPVSLADINRRYSRPAKAVGTTTNTVIQDLLYSDTVCMLERRGVSALFSTDIYKDILAVREANSMEGDLVDILIEGYIVNNK